VLAELLAVKIDHYHLTQEKEQATLDRTSAFGSTAICMTVCCSR
jgi:hypothetical protein